MFKVFLNFRADKLEECTYQILASYTAKNPSKSVQWWIVVDCLRVHLLITFTPKSNRLFQMYSKDVSKLLKSVSTVFQMH